MYYYSLVDGVVSKELVFGENKRYQVDVKGFNSMNNSECNVFLMGVSSKVIDTISVGDKVRVGIGDCYFADAKTSADKNKRGVKHILKVLEHSEKSPI